jgi:DNA-binding HxlR family transcriptional regulator
MSSIQVLEPHAPSPAALRPRRRSERDQRLIRDADAALSAVTGKWKIHLLCAMARGVHRHRHLLDALPGGSKKVLTETLRSMERDGLVTRQVFAEVPARVEYRLTPLGWTATDLIIALADWGGSHRDELEHARGR